MLLLVVAYLPLALLMAHATPLSSDEIYTYRIARQPTIARIIQLSQKIDLHPPLHYLLQRWALLLDLPRWLGSRLPSLIAGQLGLLLLFLLLARRFGNLVGMLGAAVYWFSPATNYGWSNRPYALWLFLLILTIFMWLRTEEWERPWWTSVALGLSGLALVMDYMFGLACILPILIAQGVRSREREKMDWPVWIALVLPCVAGFSYVHQVVSFHTNTFSSAYMPSLSMGVSIVVDLVFVPLVTLAVCLVTSKALALDVATPKWPAIGWLSAEWALAIGMTAMPGVLLVAAAMRHTQFFPRYAACGAVGIALLLPLLVSKYSRRFEIVGVLMVLAMLITSFVRESNDTFNWNGPWRAALATGVPPKHLESLDPSLPIVVGSATEFTEMSDRETGDVSHRLFYVTDRSAAQQYSGQTVFETEVQTAKLLGLPSQAEALQTFLPEHPQFYLVGNYLNQEQWILRYLMDHGATIQYEGKYLSTTLSDDLYRVSIAGNFK